MIDLLILVLVVIIGLIGAKKGLVAAVVKLIGFIVAIVVATTYSEIVELYIRDNYEIIENIETKIQISIQNLIDTENEDQTEMESEELTNNIDNETDELLSKIGLNIQYSEINITKDISVFVSDKVINILVKIMLFIATVLLFEIVGIVLSVIFSLPGLKLINKIGGFIVEVLQFTVILSVLLYIISLFSAFEMALQIKQYISSSVILSLLYENNIVYLIPKILNLF